MSVMMRKGEFKAYMLNVIEHMDEGSEQYRRFSELFLTACGVIDEDGNLTEEYRCSPYWSGGDDGTPLRQSVEAELLRKVSPEVRNAIMEMKRARKGKL
ncbi:hypothetical protein ACTQZK_01655 [Paraeggerthella sp. LCP19S3_G8]|uniref:hypothetical protein n=1 Tax=Paraeggerthella sp. LCP19S3_G8 TaxID=3440248 RepID=UPI003F99FA19